ncbi:DUF4255 domain-containing protein [Leptolyngbya sp. CCY15150]|uniref:DUF4255 domain-containing protein n=1 Tax=Leptolyngbya sp. CCY15150 TaxID=2767772 RepID=UPI00194E8EE6|nr:DUF4255 domain-containing protein [Leptolyngbya sp. CCY15150]
MSNYLAIATVTAALQRILQEGIRDDVPGATVTTVRPDVPSAATQAASINVYLYQATPNPTWRNADLRTRRPKGDLVKHGQAGLDLHYLLTFYGNEQELEPQRLLGSAIRTLVDQPILSHEMIQETIERSNLLFLQNSTLVEQVQFVKFIPSAITTEELSRIWSVFFQIPYALSFAYQGTAVIIQGAAPGRAALPVRRPQFYIAPNRPVVTSVEPQHVFIDQMLGRNHSLVIMGRELQTNHMFVQIGSLRITPQDSASDRVTLNLAALSPTELQQLRAGLQGIQVIHSSPDSETDAVVESNVTPVTFYPKIIEPNGVQLTDVRETDEGIYQGHLTIQLNVMVDPRQRVYVLLNGQLGETPSSYIFSAMKRDQVTQTMSFFLQNVPHGSYLVRVQVDGAESRLTIDDRPDSSTFDQYISPLVTIP